MYFRIRPHRIYTYQYRPWPASVPLGKRTRRGPPAIPRITAVVLLWLFLISILPFALTILMYNTCSFKNYEKVGTSISRFSRYSVHVSIIVFQSCTMWTFKFLKRYVSYTTVFGKRTFFKDSHPRLRVSISIQEFCIHK